jgi:hypothetical protein
VKLLTREKYYLGIKNIVCTDLIEFDIISFIFCGLFLGKNDKKKILNSVKD